MDSTKKSPTTASVLDYYAGWEKAQQEYARQYERSTRQASGRGRRKMLSTRSLLTLTFLLGLPIGGCAQCQDALAKVKDKGVSNELIWFSIR